MNRTSKLLPGITAMTLTAAVMISHAAPPPRNFPPSGQASSAPTTAPTAASAVKALLAEELNQLEREIATRMLRRVDQPIEKRARNELEIDFRILERALVYGTVDAKFESNDQAAAWLRARQIRDAVRSAEELLAQQTNASLSQNDAIAQFHKLTFSLTDVKTGKSLDDLCRSAALALANIVNSTPVESSSLPLMRPKPLAGQEPSEPKATVVELTEQVQKLAALSMPLRQQLLALAATAAASEKDDPKGPYTVLAQSLSLAKGLQSNTALTPESRLAIESQLAEGLALYSDPRTHDIGKVRIDALGQYRQTLARIGKLSLSREQMEQLSPAFTWAQANPEPGAKVMSSIEQYMDLCAKWDALNKDLSVPQTLRRPLDDLRAQFAKHRASFMQFAAKLGAAFMPQDLEQTLDEIKRIHALADDLAAMSSTIDSLNAFKIKPVGGLERRITTAAIAASNSVSSPARTEGQKYLSTVRSLAHLAQTLNGKSLAEIPPPIVQAWAGATLPAFETRWKAILVDLTTGLVVSGNTDLDKTKLIRLETAIAMTQALQTATQLEAALSKAQSLARWVDWSIDPASLTLVLAQYKDATSAAFLGYAADNIDAVDKWTRLHVRYQPLVALIVRDAAYADFCEKLPTGFLADASRLATPFENAPFATERYASYIISVWAALERSADFESAERVAIVLSRRLARDLRMSQNIDDAVLRINRRPRP